VERALPEVGPHCAVGFLRDIGSDSIPEKTSAPSRGPIVSLHPGRNGDVQVARPTTPHGIVRGEVPHRGSWTRRAAPCGWARVVVDQQVAEPHGNAPCAAIQLALAGCKRSPDWYQSFANSLSWCIASSRDGVGQQAQRRSLRVYLSTRRVKHASIF